MFDLLIKGGLVVDGSGTARRRADVGIDGDRVVAVGADLGSGRRVVEAEGRIVAPGFVDVHTHFDAQVFWDPLLTPSSLYGVTTVIAGNCGFSIAPLRAGDADFLMRMLAAVEGMPLDALRAGVPWDWATSAEFFDRVEGATSLNIGFMAGHSAIRRNVMGAEATQREATDEERRELVAVLRSSLEAGALGFSSSHQPIHVDSDGRPVPSRFADDEELVELAGLCGGFPGTSLEFIPRGIGPNAASMAHEDKALMARMSAAAERPLNWNVLRVNARTVDQSMALLEGGTFAAEHGGRVVALTMPIPSRARFSFASGMVLNAIPGWGEVMELAPDGRLGALGDPSVRARLAAAAHDAPAAFRDVVAWDQKIIRDPGSTGNADLRGRSLRDLATERGTSPFEALLDVVCAGGLGTTFSNPEGALSKADWDACVAVWRDGRALVGGSDAGAHVDFTATFDYGAYILEHAVRDHRALPLEEAVSLLTSVPATLYGLRGRGVLAEGAFADIVVFDEDTIACGELETRYDLPAGAARLYSEPSGIDAVVVNGTVVVEQGVPAGVRPGRVLRAGRDTTATSSAVS